MADNKRPEESEGIEIPDIEGAKEGMVVQLDSEHWHIIEHIFTDYTEQDFDNYVKTETDIEELRSNVIGLYNRFCAAESVFQDLRQALVIVNIW